MPTNGRAGAGHAIELDQPFGFTPQVIGVGFRHLRLDQVAGFQAVETLQEDMAVDLRCVTTGAGDGGAVVFRMDRASAASSSDHRVGGELHDGKNGSNEPGICGDGDDGRRHPPAALGNLKKH